MFQFSHLNARSLPKKSLKCSDNACYTIFFKINFGIFMMLTVNTNKNIQVLRVTTHKKVHKCSSISVAFLFL